MPVSELGERTAIILGVHRGGKGECSETLPIPAVSFPRSLSLQEAPALSKVAGDEGKGLL